ncbi:MAG: 50S ribosome-binding GTPase [Planctomycetia bacterium]|nr:50S ribosome-binding GTPase [Planctomycetia bacterium]
MTRLRFLFLLFLFLAPFLFLMGMGGYYLWETGWMFWAWWPMILCLAVSYFLAWRWTKRPTLPPTDERPGYWTDRDKIAWEKVVAKAKSFETITTDQLEDPKHYSDVALDLAKQVAEVYNLDSTDPFDHLTLPEVLACAELAAADLDELVQKYVPGVHMLRIRDMKRARKAVEWYKVGQNVYWAGAFFVDPIQTAARYLASKAMLGSLIDRLQSNVILWFHTAFIHHLGRYLIELNSGRLKVGVKRYRELLAQQQAPPAEAAPPATPEDAALDPAKIATGPKPITLAVLGSVKAGKSSLVNAMLGRNAATVDRLPVTGGTRYEFTLPGGQGVSILDTSGYGQDGPTDEDFAAAVEASRDADLILLVTQATNPGRQPDLDLLDRLHAWFASKPHLRMPPVVVAVSHIDLLSPKSEWNPPYDWQTGTRPKEANIRECLSVVKEQFGDRITAVVPVCGREGERFGVVEWLVPAIVAHLDHARGTAVLKAFEAEAGAGQWSKLGNQVVAGGKQVLNVLFDVLKGKK